MTTTRSRGITLVELLVAITLMGFVSLGLLFAMRIGLNSWQKANSRMTVDRSMVAAGDLMSAQLSGARARLAGWGERDKRVTFLYFEGRPDRLRFATDYSVASRARGGQWLAEYWFEQNAAKECRLLYNEWPWRSAADAAVTIQQVTSDARGLRVDFRPPVPVAATRVMYSGLRDCSFEYLIDTPGRPVFWSQAWPGDPRTLPRAVAVRFRAEDAGGIAPIATVATINARELWP